MGDERMMGKVNILNSAGTDFTAVTELTGYRVTQEQLDRMYTRYCFAAEFSNGREVLEIACGSGQGLGYLAKRAKRVVGGDYDEKIVRKAQKHYGNRVEIRQLDAHCLPFENQSFDLVLLYEAIYYLAEPHKSILEVSRVLKDDGLFIICTANRDWSGFNPSPYSHQYFSAPELYGILAQSGFKKVELFGDCPVRTEGMKDKVFSQIKRMAVALHLMPKTMKGKELLKRIFVGKLLSLPPEISEGLARYSPPLPITSKLPNRDYKVLFALAQKQS